MPNLVIINPFTGRIQTTKGSVRFEPTRSPEVKRAATGGVIIDPQAATRTEAEKAFQKQRHLILGSVTFDKRLKPRQKSIARIIKEARAEARQTGKKELTLIRQKTEAAFVKRGMKKPLVLFTKNIRKAVKKPSTTKETPLEFLKGKVKALEKIKGTKEKDLEKAFIEREFTRKFFPEDVSKKTLAILGRITRVAGAAAVAGAARGILGVIELGIAGGKAARGEIKLDPKKIPAVIGTAVLATGKSFVTDPVGTAVEFYTFGRVLRVLGRVTKTGVKAKETPVSQTIKEKAFKSSLPKQIKSKVNKLFRSNEFKKVINPKKIKVLPSVDIVEATRLSRPEVKALSKTFKGSDTIVIDKVPKTKAPLIVTEDLRVFNRKFLSQLPKQIRRNYKIRGNSIVRLDGTILFRRRSLSNLFPSGKLSSFLKTKGGKRILIRLKPELKSKLELKKVQLAREVSKVKRKVGVPLKKVKLAREVSKAKLARLAREVSKVKRKVGVPLKKVKLIGRETLSVINAQTIGRVNSGLKDLNVQFKFTKLRTKRRIRDLTSPVINKVNSQLSRLKKQLKITGGKFTNPIKLTFSRINLLLKNFNIRIQFKRYKLGEFIKLKKQIIRKKISIGRETLSVINAQTFGRVNSGLKDLNVQFKFTKLRTKRRIKDLTSPVINKVNSQLSRLKKQLKVTGGKFTTPIKLTFSRINLLLKNFNIRIQFKRYKLGEFIKLKKQIIRKKGREILSSINARTLGKINSGLKDLKVQFKFTKLKTKRRIRDLTSAELKKINLQLSQLKKKIKISNNVITKPIRSSLNQIKKTLPFEIKVLKVRRIQPVVKSQLEKQRRLLRKQQRIEEKIQKGIQVKAPRANFVIKNGRKVYPFKNVNTGKVRFFTSRKAWFKAVKQQAKTIKPIKPKAKLSLEKQRRLLRKQQRIEEKLKRGLPIKARRVEGIFFGEVSLSSGGELVSKGTKGSRLLKKVKLFPFKDTKTGKVRYFTSRALWIRAVKQKAKKIKPKKINWDLWLKPNPAMEKVLENKVIKIRRKPKIDIFKRPVVKLKPGEKEIRVGDQVLIQKLKPPLKKKLRLVQKQAQKVKTKQQVRTLQRQSSKLQQELKLELKQARKQKSRLKIRVVSAGLILLQKTGQVAAQKIKQVQKAKQIQIPGQKQRQELKQDQDLIRKIQLRQKQILKQEIKSKLKLKQKLKLKTFK